VAVALNVMITLELLLRMYLYRNAGEKIDDNMISMSYL